VLEDLTMNVSSLMQRDVATVRAGDSLAHAATLLRDRDCGSVVVVDEQRHPVAVLTDRDVCLTALRLGRPLAGVRVETAMSKRLFTCHTEDTVAEAECAMALHQVRRLPVVDAQGKLVGLLALDDIALEACRDVDLLAPPVSCETVGRTLGEICRPRLIVDGPAEVPR
jgi:CBS domain-containing protein